MQVNDNAGLLGDPQEFEMPPTFIDPAAGAAV
jgi:hypothetical protein